MEHIFFYTDSEDTSKLSDQIVKVGDTVKWKSHDCYGNPRYTQGVVISIGQWGPTIETDEGHAFTSVGRGGFMYTETKVQIPSRYCHQEQKHYLEKDSVSWQYDYPEKKKAYFIFTGVRKDVAAKEELSEKIN